LVIAKILSTISINGFNLCDFYCFVVIVVDDFDVGFFGFGFWGLAEDSGA
jgi:hypothetical protein